MTPLRLVFFGDPSILPPFSDGDNVLLVGQTDKLEELCRFADTQPQILLIQGTPDLAAVKTLIAHCRDHDPRVKVIVYTSFTDLPYTRAVVSAGAMGFITELHNLVSVLHTVQSGKFVLSPQITRLFLSA